MVSSPLHVLAATAIEGAPATMLSTARADSALAICFSAQRIFFVPFRSRARRYASARLLPASRPGQALSRQILPYFPRGQSSQRRTPRPVSASYSPAGSFRACSPWVGVSACRRWTSTFAGKLQAPALELRSDGNQSPSRIEAERLGGADVAPQWFEP